MSSKDYRRFVNGLVRLAHAVGLQGDHSVPSAVDSVLTDAQRQNRDLVGDVLHAAFDMMYPPEAR